MCGGLFNVFHTLNRKVFNQEGQTLTMVLSADKSSSSNREPNPIPATGETINEMLIATAIIVVFGSMFLFGEGFMRKENKLHK